jgi:hypothetical protein
MAKKETKKTAPAKVATPSVKTTNATGLTIESIKSPFTVKQMLKHSKQEVSRINQIKGQRFLNKLHDNGALWKTKIGLESVYSTDGPCDVMVNDDGTVEKAEDTAVNGSASSEEGEEPESAVRQTLEQQLSMHTGTEHYYAYKGFVAIGANITYTDGIKYLADNASAYWLIDAIMSYQTAVFRSQNPFQVWTLIPSKLAKNPNGCTLRCEDGNKNHVKTQRIEFTDFPFDEFSEPPKFFFQNNVLFLPSEH